MVAPSSYPSPPLDAAGRFDASGTPGFGWLDWGSPGKTPKKMMTKTLIITNVIAFLVVTLLREGGVFWINAGYGLVPARLTADPAGESLKLLSFLFIHDGLSHLVFNILFLRIFGYRLEAVLGRSKMLPFYLVVGVFSGIAHYLTDPQSTIPLIGASGAIAGVLGGTLVLLPRTPLTIFRWPAYKVVAAWFFFNLIKGLSTLDQEATSDTAYFAHIGGFIAGLILVRFFHSDSTETSSGLPSFHEKPRVARPKIFPREEDGPFWRT
jgi:membrane associated rhomboid family serine protease